MGYDRSDSFPSDSEQGGIGPIEGLPETPRTSQYSRIEGIEGVPDMEKWIVEKFSV